MRECRVCGLLYLMADSCPSCGSPDHLDMDADGQGQLVTAQRGGIPGLGDAERTMADLLGEDEPLTSPAGQGDRRSSLPFGMGGVLATPRTSLPFGVGSIGSAVDLPRTALSECWLSRTWHRQNRGRQHRRRFTRRPFEPSKQPSIRLSHRNRSWTASPSQPGRSLKWIGSHCPMSTSPPRTPTSPS